MNKNGFNLGVQHKIFNNEIRKRREAIGVTQKQLAILCELPIGKIGHLENFRIYPTEEEAQRIAKVLDTTPENLFPQWLKLYKPKVTKVVTEHIITEPLLSAGNLPQLLEDPTFQYQDSIDNDLLQAELSKQLKSLTDRERKILELRYGLNEFISEGELARLEKTTGNMSGGMTSQEVGRIFGVSGSRIMQLEHRALRKLRHPVRSTKLKPFIDYQIKVKCIDCGKQFKVYQDEEEDEMRCANCQEKYWQQNL